MGNITDTTVVGTMVRVSVRVRRLDAASARDFKLEYESVPKDGIDGVEIDLGRVEFVDSSGIGALLSVCKRLPSPSSVVKLLHVKPAVQSVIELLRLHRIFEIHA